MIDTINFKIDNHDILSFEFSTTKEIWIDEAYFKHELFRVQLDKEDESITVYVAWYDDYDVSEDVTHKFNETQILQTCINFDTEHFVANNTSEYEEFYAE